MYLPFLKDQQFLYMGLNRLDPTHWFEPDIEWAEFYANKQRQWQNRASQCLQALPESLPAQQELQRRMLANLAEHHHAIFDVSRQRVIHKPSETVIEPDHETPVWSSSLLVQDDLCLMQPGPDGYRLTAASLCAPSYWHLEEKIGQTLDGIHQPMPGYQQALSRSMNAFFERMKDNAPVWRANWSVVAHPGLMQRLDTPTQGDVEQDPLWLRVERQTLLRLPETKAICFTIRIHRYPLERVLQQPDRTKALRDTLNNLSAEEKNYKSLAPLQTRLTAMGLMNAHR